MSAAGRPLHHAEMPWPVVDDCLRIGGRPVTRLARQVGGTPFYAYDRKLLTERVRMLRANLPAEIHLHYAVKANPMPALVQHMTTLIDGLDVASAGEMQTALNTGVSPALVSFAGPGKRESELARAIAAGIVINMESEAEMETIARLADRHGVRPTVAVRVNPDFELKTSGMRMSGGPKQFGVDAERVPAMLKRLAALDLDFIGFHIFSGSQNLRAEAIREAQEKTIQLAIALAEHAPAPVRLLNIGGGFGIPYFPGDQPLDTALIGENLGRLLPRIKAHMPAAQVVVELGRYLVGEAGVYVCRVIDRKISRGQVFLITDGGLHHHLAASGNFGQVIRKNYPVLVGNRVTGTEREVASVVGPLCTPLDTLADKLEMAKAEVGDLIVILQSGAYGLTASPVAFLSHPPPAEILV
ncbi:MAG: pyridoxal-dependent decarboxylase, exosortase A system-associated [Gammaproteobacteria bacterium]